MKFRKGDLVRLKKGHYFGKGNTLPGSIGLVLQAKRHEPHFILYEVLVFADKVMNVRAPARCFEHLEINQEELDEEENQQPVDDNPLT